MNAEIKTLKDVAELLVGEERRFFSATHEEIRSGATADLYFIRTQEMLDKMGLSGTKVVAEIFASRSGVMAGVEECRNLLQDLELAVEAVPEGHTFERHEVVMRISGRYGDFCRYETALLGILASSCAWATAARECKEAAGHRPVVCFGARHVHPAVAPVMERAALVGGADGASCILAPKFLGREPMGTVPHAFILMVGDTVQAARAYNEHMPDDAPRIILVDTFKDEAEEALRVAGALGERLDAVRLDTPAERGGVTPGLVREVRARLDQAGFDRVKIFISGGLTPDRIRELAEAGGDAFGVGSYISGARPIDMTMDLKEIDGRAVAKRGRIPGRTDNPSLRRL